jgi:hypothetical protein
LAYAPYVFVALLAAALTFSAIGSSAGHQGLSFARPRHSPTGKSPDAIAAGDLNGDRRPDLVVVNGPALSVLLNRGDGSFVLRRDYPTTHAQAVALGDLNGDGKLDVATANGDYSVSVLLGRGDGTFAPRRDYPIGTTFSISVAIGDVNGDGMPDLAAVNELANTIAVLLNAGDGTFPTRHDYATRDDPNAVAIGDLNGDRRADLVAVSDEAISVLLNRGDGGFGPRHDYATGHWSQSVAVADLNADGAPDLATDNSGDPGDTVSVFLNRGDGTFHRRRDYAATDAVGIAIGDLTGDGKPELVTRGVTYNDSGDSTVSVLVNRGNGSFEPKLGYPAGKNPASLALGDLNGDRRLDMATANLEGDDVSVLLNNPNRCTVQDVWRMTVPVAKRTTAHANCRVRKVRRKYSRLVKRGRVISQKPEPFAVLPKGSPVSLVVSRGRER